MLLDATPPQEKNMNIEELKKHRLALEKYSERFDAEENLIDCTIGIHAYHTALAGKKAHGLRESMEYAAALLYGEDEKYTERGVAILEKVVDFQDKNPESPTFGLWQYYAEEPFDEMMNPDFNWADFLGKKIIEALYVHRDKLPEHLIEKMNNACRYACESVIRRKEGVQYTNIAFMEALLLISTGELLNEKKYLDYGCEQLGRFIGFYKYQGGFFEYNSPCYTPLITRDVGTFLKLIKNKKAREYAEEINDMCWKMIAEHFRADMLQLSGPHSRAYDNFLNDEFLYDIELACEGEVDFGRDKKYTIETFWTKAYCPEKYRKYFKGEVLPESTEQIIIRGFNHPFFAFAQTATTFHDEKFSLGTFNREEFWNQRRHFIGYIKGETNPYCFRVRCLHDGYDFSSAALHCVQEKSTVLGIVNFSSDRGDKHIGMDKAADAQYESLELIFEVTGDMNNVTYEHNQSSCYINVNGVNINICVPEVKFGDNIITYKVVKEDNRLVFSTILYEGEKRKIDLPSLDASYACFNVSVNSDVSEAKFSEDDKYVTAECESFGRKLGVKTLKAVHPFMNIMYDDLITKDGKKLENIL